MYLILKSMTIGAVAVISTFGTLTAIALTVRYFGGGKTEYYLVTSAYLMFVASSFAAYGYLKSRKP